MMNGTLSIQSLPVVWTKFWWKMGMIGKTNHELIIHLSIKRKYLFYLLFLVFPNMILYLMSGLTFLLPAESGEKVSCAVTLFLAQVVSFGTLANIFPASSRSLPVMAYFVVIVTFHMGISCLLAIFIVNIHVQWSRCKVYSRMLSMIKSRRLQLIGLKPYQSIKNTIGRKALEAKQLLSDSSGATSKRDHLDTAMIDNSHSNPIDYNWPKTERDEFNQEEMAKQWKYFAIVVDRLVCVLHAIIVTGVVILFFLLVLL
ncbi:neuronal acetylcholine receptor subunit beta-3-like [Convolutriloba macropyga]|uniref:neuronal acetylcholine receptor subunit beta-3-like n=1 Tax=Convolutriloba macropyga TaxID=536237 RepID=UPI003F525064